MAPRGRSFSWRTLWIKKSLHGPGLAKPRLQGRDALREHHESNAASAFIRAIEEARTHDRWVGEWEILLGHGKENAIDVNRELHWPEVLDALMTAFTNTQDQVNSESTGHGPAVRSPKYVQQITTSDDLKEDGSLNLNRATSITTGLTMRTANLTAVTARREKRSMLTDPHGYGPLCQSLRRGHDADGAHPHALRVEESLPAGGVALNCVGTGRILQRVLEQSVNPRGGRVERSV